MARCWRSDGAGAAAPIKDVAEKGYWRLEGERDNQRRLLVDFVDSVKAVYLYSKEPKNQGCKRISRRLLHYVIPYVAMLFRSFAVQITLGLLERACRCLIGHLLNRCHHSICMAA